MRDVGLEHHRVAGGEGLALPRDLEVERPLAHDEVLGGARGVWAGLLRPAPLQAELVELHEAGRPERKEGA